MDARKNKENQNQTKGYVMDWKLNLHLAKAAGKTEEKNGGEIEVVDWLHEYNYHLGAVENPFPFELFRTKYRLLNRYFAQDPKAKDRTLDRDIYRLCNELGY